MKITMAISLLQELGFDTDLSRLSSSDCVLAVDDKHLTSYDISHIVNSQSRNIYGKDMLESLYNNLIAKWLVGDLSLACTQWGVYTQEENTFITPVKITQPFDVVNRRFKYRYGPFQVTPDTMVLLVRDKLYTTMLFNTWIKLRNNYAGFCYHMLDVMKDNRDCYNECVTFMSSRIVELDVLFLESFIRDVDFNKFVKDFDTEVYDNLQNRSGKEILNLYGDSRLISVINEYLSTEYNYTS